MTTKTSSTPRGKLILMRAPSGAGKSTYIKTHLPGALVCSADAFMYDKRTGLYDFKVEKLGWAHKSCFEACEKGMRDGVPVIVIDNTNIQRKWYKNYVDLAKKLGYEVYQKCLTTQFQNVHGVPDEKVAQMRESFEEDPTLPHWQE